jgi:hexosaminidase
MIKGSYSPRSIYTSKDIQYLMEYAADRGVLIIFEVDMPGHTGSWRFGYPDIMADCIDKYTNVNSK